MLPDWLLYLRTSTIGQAENNTSMGTQNQEGRRKAAEIGYDYDPTYVLTETESGAFWDRPALEEMLRIVKAALVSLVVIFNSDRLARDPLHLLMIIRTFAEAGVRLEFVHGSSDNSPEGQLLAYCTGWAAQRERTMIAERSRLGKQAVAKSGRLPNGLGPGMFGYDYHPESKTATVNEGESRVVQLVYRWASEGVNVNQIAVRLNDMQIPTKRGKRWSRAAIIKVLTNTSYFGLMEYGKYRHRKVGPGKIERTERPAEEVIPIWDFTPAIISKELYDRVQEQMKVPKSRRGTKQGNRYLCTGFIRCGWCNSPITGAMKARGTRYYRCTGAVHRTERPAICGAKYIHEDVEQVVWSTLEEAIRHPEILSREIEQFVSTGEGNIREEVKRLGREIADNDREQRRLIRLYGKEEIDADILGSEVATLQLVRVEKERELQALEEQQKNMDAASEAEVQIREFCERLLESLENLDFEGRRAVMAAMGLKATVTEEKIAMTVVVDPSVTATSPYSP